MTTVDLAPFSADQVALLVRAAGRAPSIHNTQPWRFRVEADRVEVHLDTTRMLRAADLTGRQRVISCGAATFNLHLAMANLGHVAHTVLLPDPTDPNHLATVVRGRERAPTQTERRLYEALPHRRTHRHGFLRVPVTPATGRALHDAAAAEGAWTREPAAKVREEFAALIVHAATVLVADPVYRTELAEWTRTRGGASDGVPLGSLASGRYPVNGLPRPYLLPPVVSPDRMADEIGITTALVIGTRGDTPVDWLRCGQALERLLLTATAQGLAASFASQVIEVESTRRRLTEILELPGPPHVVLWVGHPAGAVPGTSRRSIADVLA